MYALPSTAHFFSLFIDYFSQFRYSVSGTTKKRKDSPDQSSSFLQRMIHTSFAAAYIHVYDKKKLPVLQDNSYKKFIKKFI